MHSVPGMGEPADKRNIVLIGMPGSGKSTIGAVLARLTARDFVDTDRLIEMLETRSLQDLVDAKGYRALRKIEEDVLLGLDCRNHVIATGGSAVYSYAAMMHLRSHGTVVFLDADLATLKGRIHNFDTRGLAKPANQSFADLFEERRILYANYSDVTVDCSVRSPANICLEIMERLGDGR
ncbi:MAG: shikimate kinase [Thermodesulfovibrionales bacterium]